QDEKMKEVNEKFDKLCVNFVEMALHLEEKFYPRLLTTIVGSRWLLTHGIELVIAKCLNSTEYLSTLGAAISKTVEKADYLSALQRLQSVNFSLIVELRANKDASIDTIMNLLRLEDTLAERLGLTESRPHVNQLMVLIHHSLDQRVIGASALSLSLDVSSSRVREIKENIANHVSALRDVFVPLSEPLSIVALEGTSGGSPGTADITTTISIVVASTSIVRPISIDDYEVTGADDQATADKNVADKDANPFPNVDDAELNSTSDVLIVGMPISAGMNASVSYVNENEVSPLLDFIIMRCAHRTRGSSSIQVLLLAPTLLLFLRLSYNISGESEPADNVVLYEFFDLIASDGHDSPAPEPSVQEDLSVNRIHGSGSSSSSIGVSGESFSGLSTMKSANICPLTDTLGL
ncbi:hypothetical protein Tco_1435009, partial [Tanacetum coccineum]